jgi:hypothetical protein
MNHVVGTNTYFRVSGERREYAIDETTGKLADTGRNLSKRIRFEAMKLHDAEAFATDVYRREGLVCEIHEVFR